MRREVPLFTLFGVRVTANWTWLVIVMVIVWVASQTFAQTIPSLDERTTFGLSVVAAVLTVASLYAHEMAHAMVALRNGHVVRSISLFFFGGNADIAGDALTPKTELAIALAGPLTSLGLGAFGGLVALLTGGFSPLLAGLGTWLAVVNIPLAIFNLLPFYPLDGGRIMRGLVWWAADDRILGSSVTARAGQAAALVLLMGGISGVVSGGSGSFAGLWLLLVAWFLFAGAMGSHRSTVVRDALHRLRSTQVMQRNVGRVDADMSLSAFAEMYAGSAGILAQSEFFGVYRDDEIIGVITVTDLRRSPESSWKDATVALVMLPIYRCPTVDPEATALEALEAMPDRWNLVAVMAEERLLGLVTREALAKAVVDARSHARASN